MAEQITITTEYIKLDQFLKFSGAAATGGEAKELIQAGMVYVNGSPCQMRGRKLRGGDHVMAKGKEYEVTGEAAGGNQPD